MTEPGLFPEPEHVERSSVRRADGLSDGQWLTLRQRQAIDNGVHPLAKTRLDPDDEHVCGNCSHRRPARYPKCDRWPQTRGPATDCRAWWPACTQWEPK